MSKRGGGNMTRLDRIIWIDAQIQAGKYPSVRDVMEKFGVARRIAFYDRRYMIDVIEAPLKYSKTHRGWYYTKSDYSIWKLTDAEKTLLNILKSEIEFLRERIEELEDDNRELRTILLKR